MTDTRRPPPLIHARGLTKRFGEFTAVDAIDFDVAPGESFGFLGPNGAGKTSTMRMVACVSPVTAGTLRILDLDPVTRRAADPRPPGRRAPAGHAGHGALGQGQPRDLRPLLRAVARRGLAARRRAARVRPADRARERQGRAAVGRHEAAPDDRPVAHQRALDPAARRADDGPRPAGAPPAVGAAVPAQAARRDARADDPLHGRGRAAVRPARRHGQGADRRRGLAAPADRGVLHRARSPSSGSRSASRRRSTGSSTGLGERIEHLPDRVLVYSDDGEAAAAAAHQRGLEPETVLVRRSSLEDVFLRLTGRSLVD